MSDRKSTFGKFVAELQRRHVVRVMVTYAAVAFVVLQLAEITFPAFSVQQGALRLLVILAALGLPVVLVLAWVFDITPEGIRRTEDLGGQAGPADSVLPRLALVVVTLVTVGAVGWWAVGTNLEPVVSVGGDALSSPVQPVSYDPSAPITSLAVLPLDDFSAEPQEYFAAGMHEALVAKLSQLPALRVVSRTSVMRYAGQGVKTAPEIARELNVDGIVEGSVVLDGDRVRITVQLIHAPSDTHVWTESYEEDFSDILGLQADVAEAIAQEIQGQLSPDDEAMLATAGLASPVNEAQESFMKGRFENQRGTVEGYREAVQHLEEAVRLDPDFASAHVSLAGAELMLGLSDPEAGVVNLTEARQHAERALELNEELPEVHEVLAMIDMELASRVGELSASGVQILAPDPVAPAVTVVVSDSAEGLPRIGPPLPGREVQDSEQQATRLVFRVDSTRWMVGVTEMGQQLRRAWATWSEQRVRDGTDQIPQRLVQTARQLRLAGHTEAAQAMLEEVCESNPEFAQTWEDLEQMYATSGQYERIVQLRRDKAEVGHGDESEAETIADALARQGPRGYWGVRLEELERMDEAGADVSKVQIAQGRAALGDIDGAIGALQEAFRERDVNLVSLGRDPFWDPLRRDPRFKSLMMRFRPQARGRPRRPPGG